MTTALFLGSVAIFVVLYLGVQAALGFGASRFDAPSPLERNARS